jgi:hypothetical protein
MGDLDFLESPRLPHANPRNPIWAPKAKRKAGFPWVWLLVGLGVVAMLGGVAVVAMLRRDPQISGELFFKTKGGDTKKAGGETVFFTPITPPLQKTITALVVATHDKKADWNDAAAHVSLAENAATVVANADGKFSTVLPPGRYLLWTTTHSILGNEFFWIKVITVSDSPLQLELGSDSTLDCPGEQSHLVALFLASERGWVKWEKAK